MAVGVYAVYPSKLSIFWNPSTALFALLYSLGEADILRKAMSKKKKDILLKEKEIFKERAVKKGYDEKLVDNKC